MAWSLDMRVVSQPCMAFSVIPFLGLPSLWTCLLYKKRARPIRFFQNVAHGLAVCIRIARVPG